MCRLEISYKLGGPVSSATKLGHRSAALSARQATAESLVSQKKPNVGHRKFRLLLCVDVDV